MNESLNACYLSAHVYLRLYFDHGFSGFSVYLYLKKCTAYSEFKTFLDTFGHLKFKTNKETKK